MGQTSSVEMKIGLWCSKVVIGLTAVQHYITGRAIVVQELGWCVKGRGTQVILNHICTQQDGQTSIALIILTLLEEKMR